MAVMEPIPRIVGDKFYCASAHVWLDDECIFMDSISSHVALYYFEEMSVQMHRMWHHAMIEVINPNPFTFVKKVPKVSKVERFIPFPLKGNGFRADFKLRSALKLGDSSPYLEGRGSSRPFYNMH